MDNSKKFFGVILQRDDESFQEWGGQCRTWSSRRALELERNGRRMTLIRNVAEGEAIPRITHGRELDVGDVLTSSSS